MIPIGTIYQIDNGFVLEVQSHEGYQKSMIYCKNHKEIADTIVSKRVAEMLRDAPRQEELPLDKTQVPSGRNKY
jgi:hypothetical protein